MQLRVRACSYQGQPLRGPNFGVFDRSGNYYFSESGDYWSKKGSGRIFLIRANGHLEEFHAGPFHFANGLAIDQRRNALLVVESTARRVVQVPLDHPNGKIAVRYLLPKQHVPDGICITATGELVICCYRPDEIYVGFSNNRIKLLHEDPTGELLNRPANAILCDSHLLIANLGGRHLTKIRTKFRPAETFFPKNLRVAARMALGGKKTAT